MWCGGSYFIIEAFYRYIIHWDDGGYISIVMILQVVLGIAEDLVKLLKDINVNVFMKTI